jgi:hypothetical protein
VLVKGGEMDYMYIKQDIFYYDVVVDDCAWTIRETLVRTKWKTVFTESDVALITKRYSTGFFFIDRGKVSRCDNHVSLRRVMSRRLKKAMDYEKNVVLKDL